MSTRRDSLFELRSYSAQPGQRDALIGMFVSLFLDAYQASGARILGTFRSLDDPDRWVWIRAFADARSRGRVLDNFYGGEVWKRNAKACDALIANVGEAILLRAVRAEDLDELFAPPSGTPVPDSLYELVIYSLAAGQMLGPTATFITDRSENSYPRQPVRSDSVSVTLTRLASMAALETHAFAGKVAVMRLAPASRSALR